MRAAQTGRARDGCTAHGETVRGVVFHFKERRERGMRGRESGEGDGGQNRMSDEKAETEGGRGERRRKAMERQRDECRQRAA